MKKLFIVLAVLLAATAPAGCDIAVTDTGRSRFDNFNGTDNPTNYLDNDLITISPRFDSGAENPRPTGDVGAGIG
jgi:hypothetical protein